MQGSKKRSRNLLFSEQIQGQKKKPLTLFLPYFITLFSTYRVQNTVSKENQTVRHEIDLITIVLFVT